MLCNVLRFLALIPVTLVLNACSPPAGDSGNDDEAGLSVKLVLKDRFGQPRSAFNTIEQDPDDLVTFELSVTNNGAETETLVFGGCLGDYAVTAEDGTEVWRLSRDNFCATVMTELELQPGQTHTETYIWDQRRNEGTPVALGNYVVTGEYLNHGGSATADAKLLIKESNLSVVLVLKDTHGVPANAFLHGEPVTFELSITNNSAGTEVLGVGGCPADYRVVVQGGAEVWKLSDSVACTEILQIVTLEADETYTNTYVWEQQTSDDETPAAAGDYVVTGEYPGYGEATAELEIQ